jgi:hypothetical protein
VPTCSQSETALTILILKEISKKLNHSTIQHGVRDMFNLLLIFAKKLPTVFSIILQTKILLTGLNIEHLPIYGKLH